MPLRRLKIPRYERHDCGSEGGSLSIDIVAVHGLNETDSEAWTEPSSRILWLRDLLPKAVPVARVLTFGYRAHASSFYGNGSADRIQQHSHTLVADLQADRALEGCPQRPLIFICHGLGGILVKKALAYSASRMSKNVEHLYSIFTSTYAILFFGTPHLGLDQGSSTAGTQSQAQSILKPQRQESQLLLAIERESETLQAITDQFAPLMKQFRMFFFWEEIPSDMTGGPAYVVTEASAAPTIDNTERSGIEATHAEMIRFSDASSTSYRTVIAALVRYCRAAPIVISRRWQQATEALARARSNEAIELAGTAFDVHNDGRPFQYERKTSERPNNKFFYIPQVVSSVFTGREDAASIVTTSLINNEEFTAYGQQRRFVIYGIGGSGKTQFCSKFAQDYRENFWGVFWIDATSVETAKQSYAKIGKLGGMEATQNAGKHWLSNVDEPWLLIINNADDRDLDLPGLFPEGERGHILVTTRNPSFRIHATVGHLEFTGLGKQDALLLLLRASDFPRPWDSVTKARGNKITDALGYLALAIIQAGALILEGCRIDDYLGFFQEFRKKISARQSAKDSKPADQTIYATWEHSINSLHLRGTEENQDAIQLLSIVGFFHFEDIRVDVFTRALDNRVKASGGVNCISFFERIMRGLTARLQPLSVLPNFLRGSHNELDPSRIRRALHVLRSFSLISYNSRDDSFSLHPVVHFWARERLTRGEQALWAQIALNVLAGAVLLPPNDSGQTHEEFRRDILPHLDMCLRGRPLQILDYDSLFGGFNFPFALVLRHSMLFIFRDQVMTAAKLGYVYAERGRFNEAAVLLSQVKNALIQSRGVQNENTMRAMLGLAGTYWGLGRLEEAIALQKMVVDARSCSLGPDHSDTLSAMDQLGRSFWLYGQYVEALELQTLTVQRMKRTLGAHHADTLSAVDNLGVTYGSWQRFDDSMELHLQVLASRKKTLGPHHLDTLTTMNNLAMALKDLGTLDTAKELMAVVYEQRKQKLGKEHPWTLWALCNLAKVYTELRRYEEAEDMLVPGIAAAKRSLSDDHLGVLMGIGELTRIYARQKRFKEAESLSQHLISNLEASRGVGHPDTVYSLYKTAHIYEMQGKIAKAIELCELADQRVRLRITLKHPLATEISVMLQRLGQTPHVPISQSNPELPLSCGSKKLQTHKTF